MIQNPQWAVCLGGASCAWEDFLRWEGIYGREWDGVIVIANDLGAHWPREFHHWATLHPNKLAAWKALRKRQRLPDCGPITWGKKSRNNANLVDRAIDPWGSGSSGMLAAQVAKTIGCAKVVLCGIPMTPTEHFAETNERFNRQWAGAAGHWKAWLRQEKLFQGWLKSMSGRTMELLGDPSLEWLHTG